MNGNIHENASVKEEIPIPDCLYVAQSPHIKGRETTRTIMLDVIIALIPACIWGVHVFGIRALWLILISVSASVLFELVFELITKRSVTIGDFSAVVTGLLIAMNLSVRAPLWIPLAGAFFAIIVVKQLFGGIGKNIVNPALAASVLMSALSSEAGTFAEPFHADAIAGATPLTMLKGGVIPDVKLADMFFGNTSGCIGEVSALLLIAGGLYLLIRRVITWHIPIAYIGTVALITLIFPQAGNGIQFMLYELLSGGLMLGAFFMATDYSTSPMTKLGKIIFGVGCGIITVLIRYYGSPEGVAVAILIMNLTAVYIDRITWPKKFAYRSSTGKQKNSSKSEAKLPENESTDRQDAL